ncbi:hypothetical protein [Tritonibacter mobilis]|uniref:hypothetical protein n=1 Tax=Tritonibacter mobilis TaxID=379347 RepID=UPI001C09C0D8|nr:hypothetical protein [Tritonibacter mobilis]MBU3035954.1 hypothetical protein [Tritonibacter mobilis]WHQ85372.1 hypothetical protein OMR53_21840 [Tritonibacter mobilis]
MILETHTAAQTLKAVAICDRANWLLQRGATLTPPDPAPFTWDESRACVHFLNITAEGTSITEAISNWIAAALKKTPRRATDGRPICPFNGQPPIGAMPGQRQS